MKKMFTKSSLVFKFFCCGFLIMWWCRDVEVFVPPIYDLYMVGMWLIIWLEIVLMRSSMVEAEISPVVFSLAEVVFCRRTCWWELWKFWSHCVGPGD